MIQYNYKNQKQEKEKTMEYKEEILEKCLPKYLEEDLKKLKEGI